MLTRYADLYYWFLVNRFKILMEYRVNFIIGATSTIFVQAAGLATIWVVMSQIPSLNGWTLEEILMIYGLLTLGKSINHMFADNLWTLGWQYVRSGAFDQFMVRPIDPLFHLLADRFCHDGIGNFLVGSALVIQSSIALGIEWTPLRLLYLAIAVLSGGVIFIALNLITATSAFWLMDSIPVTQVIFNLNDFAKYPLTIYNRGIGVLLTWLVPYGFASFYPASYILGRDVGSLALLGPLVAALFLLIAYRIWLFGLKHYSGTGS